MVKDRKKAKLTERAPQDNADRADDKLILSIEKLQKAQDDLEKVNEDASDEVLEIEQKYNELRKHVYLKRSEIIKTIPDFWLTAFLSHPALGDLLSDEDKKIFNYLKSLEVEDFKDVKSGYAIRFNFDENPYFEYTKLTKTFTFFDDGTSKISSTTIKWKEGMDVNGVKHEKKGNKRTHVEDSFFSWFSDSEQKDMAELQDDVGEIIKEDLWPNPLKYFNNDADDEDSEGDEEENGDDDGEEDSKGDG